MKLTYILFNGLLLGFVTEFLVSLSETFFEKKLATANWSYYFLIAVAFFLIKLSMDKGEDEQKLDNIQTPLLVSTSIMAVGAIVGIAMFILNKNFDRLAISMIALGTPNLVALFWWNKKKSEK